MIGWFPCDVTMCWKFFSDFFVWLQALKVSAIMKFHGVLSSGWHNRMMVQRMGARCGVVSKGEKSQRSRERAASHEGFVSSFKQADFVRPTR